MKRVISKDNLILKNAPKPKPMTMEEQIINPYELLAIGMLTVFVILILVVVTGNLIIRFVNRFLPEKVKEKVAITINSAAINSKKMAAIVSAVQVVTKGKGKVVKVEKM